ncbi:aminoglycoside phosphotransferase family protein [Candidatus Enterococcus ferrettii]|uniref:Aminoglycoside phosphotransferase domain-containing protein n=1 Tax=Candidatus Enterococcus ferrettii TaxID=2815324 RepID=A0ABV0EXP9_9ENTE|nr:aminoglycoside phosphotransferase family protein [Enterococcus sp. 665A]MBO1342258.1 aminoglycoside phosphotransferase family protein [Enterococcus sp. 665A]
MEAVMILNTKKISADMQKRFGAIYPLMLPFEEGTIEESLLEKYREKDYVFILSDESQAESDEPFRKRSKSVYELFMTSKESRTLLQVVRNGLKRILSLVNEDFHLTINFGDTYVLDDSSEVADYIVIGERDNAVPWTSVIREEKRLKFSNKNEGAQNKPSSQLVAGVFGFQSSREFLLSCMSVLLEEYEQGKNGRDDSRSFYEAIKDYDENYHSVDLLSTNAWLDLGHEKEYLETKKLVQARFFNSITIDDQRGILTKKSDDTKKLIHEIEWYIKMPEELQFFTPRIYNYSLDKEQPCVEMEYYPYETLHNLYIYGNLEISDWEKIMDKLLFVRQEMKLHSENKQLDPQDLKDIYYQKTVARVERLMEDPAFEVFYENAPTINGVTYQPVKAIMEQLLNLLEDNQLISEKSASIIHGDFCLSNILFEVSNQLVKLIDPRGKFGSFDIYGDEFYDIAKIMHSFEGAYDHIITDQFSLEQESSTVYSYTIHKTELQNEITELVNESIAKLYPIEQVRLIEGLLFLSMIPLHADYPDRQKIMFGQAMKLLMPYLGGS